MTKQVSEAQVKASISSIEKQLAKPFKKLGKVYMPKGGASLSRAVTVESRVGATIRVTVSAEHNGGWHPKSTGTYAVLVQEVRDVNSRVKHRARDFTELPAKLSDEQVETIVACVQKHLAVRDEVRLQEDERHAQLERADQENEKRDAHLGQICKAHGIKASADGFVYEIGLRVTCQGDAFNVSLDHLSEADLKQFLTFWKERGAKTAREARLTALGFEEPSYEQRKANLALNVVLREPPKDRPKTARRARK